MLERLDSRGMESCAQVRRQGGRAAVVAVSREQAKDLAIAYVATLDLKGYRYEYVGTSFDANWPDEWGVVFDIYSPGGNLVDGPVVFAVEKETGRVRTFRPK
jgi:hypothetical protein